MAAGPKRHRVIVQQDQGTARNGLGEVVPSWVTLATVWAEGGPLTGRELWNARQVQGEITHRFKCRWGSVISDLTGNVRLLFNGSTRVMHVVAPLNLNELNWEWQLDCKEAPDTASAAMVGPPDFYSTP